MPLKQIPSIILPTAWSVGNEQEAVDDLLEHTSIEFDCENLQEKTIFIAATEVIGGVGVPGNLWLWVELSPYDTPTSAAFWAALGGGGGAIAPTAPIIELPVGVNGRVHSIPIAWTMHSAFARLVVQTPAAPGAPLNFWNVQAIITGKSYV